MYLLFDARVSIMHKIISILFFIFIAVIILNTFKQTNDILVLWATNRYKEPTSIYLTIVEFRFFELLLSSISVCYAFNIYMYLFHRELFIDKNMKINFAINFIIPLIPFIPLFFINQIVVLTTKNQLSIPLYVRTINTVYSLTVIFLYISYAIIKYAYRMNWRTIGKTIHYSIKYLEYIVIYIVIGYIVYAFLTIIIVNPVFMTITRVFGMGGIGIHGSLLIIPAVLLESLILYIYFLLFIEPFINEVKLDVAMKKYIRV